MDDEKARTLTVGEPEARWFPIGMVIGLGMLLGLLYAGAQIVFLGHHAFATTKEVPWGSLIINYAWAISTIGLSYIASFGVVLGLKQFDTIVRRSLYLALLVVVAGVIGVFADLAAPLHAPFLMLTTHFTGAMGVVAMSINLYIVLIAAELYLVIKRGHNDILVKVVAVLAFGAAVLVHSYHGAIFGMQYMRSFWFGNYYPIYFLLSALFTSSAIIIFVTVATYKMTGMQMSNRLQESLRFIGKMLVYLLVVALFFLYWKMVPTHFAHKKEAYKLLTGDFAFNFWICEVLMTYMLPIAIIVYARFKDLNKMAVAGLLVAVGLWFGRYDFIVVGQLVPYLAFVPFDSDLGGSLTSTFASYRPNLTEIAFSIGQLGFIVTGYMLGVKYLPLTEEEGEEP
jgi:Ni/Fe-hydrogenase subunit HybB-like protein